MATTVAGSASAQEAVKAPPDQDHASGLGEYRIAPEDLLQISVWNNDAMSQTVPVSGDGTFTGPINLGNPSEVTILELAERIVAMTDSRSGIVFKPLPSDDPVQRRPDIALARQHLGWEPRVPIEIGLARTVEYFRDVLRKV